VKASKHYLTGLAGSCRTEKAWLLTAVIPRSKQLEIAVPQSIGLMNEVNITVLILYFKTTGGPFRK
jgi:hypothetical protein